MPGSPLLSAPKALKSTAQPTGAGGTSAAGAKAISASNSPTRARQLVPHGTHAAGCGVHFLDHAVDRQAADPVADILRKEVVGAVDAASRFDAGDLAAGDDLLQLEIAGADSGE